MEQKPPPPKQSFAEKRNLVRFIQDKTLSLFNAFYIEFDASGSLVGNNNSLLKFFDIQHERLNLSNSSFFDLLEPDDHPILKRTIDELMNDKGHTQLIQLRLKIENRNIWLNGNIFMIHQSEDSSLIRGVFQNVTDSITREKLIEYMAYNDNLTGLPNKISIEKKLSEEMEKAASNKTLIAFIFLGIDNFKQINNSLGYKMGDRILFSFTNRLLKKKNEHIFLGRWSGDIFAIIITGFTQINQIHMFCQELIKMGNTPLKFRDSHYYISFSLGASIYPEDGNSIEMIFTNTEKTLLWMKNNGRNNYRLYLDIPDKKLRKNELALRTKLTDAIGQDKIDVYFQPKMDSATNSIVGMEALSRWHDSEFGWVSPIEFITVAENVGLISQLGDYIIKKAFSYFKKLESFNLKLAVNISQQQLIHVEFIDKLKGYIHEFQLDPSHIILEITETVAMLEAKQFIEQLDQIKKHGFEISIDDFGTGYSSFSRLYQMPIDELKIDISFVRQIHEEKGLRIIPAITQIGHALKLRLVAEGVEDKDSLNILKQLGVQNIQGYIIEKPLPYSQFVEFLENWDNNDHL